MGDRASDPSDVAERFSGGHEFYREYLTESGEVLQLSPDMADPLSGLNSALVGRRLQSVVPRCTCGWRGTEIDRSAVDLSTGRPDQDPFAQWFLRHLVP